MVIVAEIEDFVVERHSSYGEEVNSLDLLFKDCIRCDSSNPKFVKEEKLGRLRDGWKDKA